MKVLALVLVFVAIAYGQRLPFPEALKEKIPNWDLQDPYIVGGSQVKDGERPFQGILLQNGSFICGGSFIASNKVLTAAHCVYGNENNPGIYAVRYNTLSLSSGPTIKVSRISRHPQYNTDTIDFDFAVLILQTSFTPGINTAVVTIAKSAPADMAMAIVSGFGRKYGGGPVSQVLLKADLNIVNPTQCKTIYLVVNDVTPRMICAGNLTAGACNGDSGGPLTVKGEQVGIVSWAVSMCPTAFPTVFGYAVNQRDWITSQ